MQYKIAHTTTYSYSEPVAVCHNQVLLTPRADGRAQCHSHRLSIRPTPTFSSRRKDYFGNQVHVFSVEDHHRQLVITATCQISIQPAATFDMERASNWEHVRQAVAEQTTEDWLDAWSMLCDSPRVKRDEVFAEYARRSFVPDRPVLAALLELTSRIHEDFHYDKEATDVHTSPVEAFRSRKGVCQDFAHVEIACLRSIGIPARYISGYLRTLPPPGKPRLVGADQSHAWVSAFCGGMGWIEVDPTNDALVSSDHIPLAFGRDYGDVAPIKGVFLGGGKHSLSVSVDVCPLEE